MYEVNLRGGGYVPLAIAILAQFTHQGYYNPSLQRNSNICCDIMTLPTTHKV